MAKLLKGFLRLDVKDNSGKFKMTLATEGLDDKKDKATEVAIRGETGTSVVWIVTDSNVSKGGTRLKITGELSRGDDRILADLVGDLTVTMNFGAPFTVSKTCFGDPD